MMLPRRTRAPALTAADPRPYHPRRGCLDRLSPAPGARACGRHRGSPCRRARRRRRSGRRSATSAWTSAAPTSSGRSSSTRATPGPRSRRARPPPQADDGPEAVVARIAETGAGAMAEWPGVASVGIGIPGLYDPAAGTTRFLVNFPGDWAGRPVAGPGVRPARGARCPDQRRPRVRARGAPAGRGPRRAEPGRPDAGHGRRRGHRGRRAGRPGPRRHRRRARAPDDRPRRAARAAAATTGASRPSRGPTGSRRPAGRRPPRRRWPARGTATRGRSTGWRGSAATWASGSRT